MLQVLEAGPSAERVLLRYLADEQLEDEVIILLGGVGNKAAIEPIISAIPAANDNSELARRRKLVANLALTNITVSDIIWHHGGGFTVDRCPDDPKGCWTSWWEKNKNTFKVTATPSRAYSNYPNYGIYRQP
jgi:hypothetical protein